MVYVIATYAIKSATWVVDVWQLKLGVRSERYKKKLNATRILRARDEAELV